MTLNELFAKRAFLRVQQYVTVMQKLDYVHRKNMI